MQGTASYMQFKVPVVVLNCQSCWIIWSVHMGRFIVHV